MTEKDVKALRERIEIVAAQMSAPDRGKNVNKEAYYCTEDPTIYSDQVATYRYDKSNGKKAYALFVSIQGREQTTWLCFFVSAAHVIGIKNLADVIAEELMKVEELNYFISCGGKFNAMETE